MMPGFAGLLPVFRLADCTDQGSRASGRGCGCGGNHSACAQVTRECPSFRWRWAALGHMLRHLLPAGELPLIQDRLQHPEVAVALDLAKTLLGHQKGGGRSTHHQTVRWFSVYVWKPGSMRCVKVNSLLTPPETPTKCENSPGETRSAESSRSASRGCSANQSTI